MAHLWAFEVVMLAGLGDAPLSKALQLVELGLFLSAWWSVEERDQRWGEHGLLTLKVLHLHSVVRHLGFRQRFEGFEFFSVLGCLQLTDFLGQHCLGLERFLLDGGDQLLLLVNDLLELVNPFIVALLLMSALVVSVVDRFYIWVDFLNLIQRRPAFKRQNCIINHLTELSSESSYPILLRLAYGVKLLVDRIAYVRFSLDLFMHLGRVFSPQVGRLFLEKHDLIVCHADLLHQILMFHTVFTRDFLLLANKSKHELIEVSYDILDFFALKWYLA